MRCGCSRHDEFCKCRLEDLSWSRDSLVFFAHQGTKNDPNAEKVNPKHFHATPLQPETCPILALAIYIFTKQWTKENDQLLFGDRESDAYQSLYRVLKAVLKDIGDEISGMGLDPHKIGFKE